MEWHKRDPARWRVEQAVAAQILVCVQSGVDIEGHTFHDGHLSVLSRHNVDYGPFHLRIVYPSAFPEHRLTPDVYLQSHRDRWRNGFDSHIEDSPFVRAHRVRVLYGLHVEHHWRLCLFVPGETDIDFTKEDSLRDLLATAAVFLRKEMFYQRDLEEELTGSRRAIWPGEDRAHGVAGLKQMIKDRGSVRPFDPCICGSGRSFYQCCMDRVGGSRWRGRRQQRNKDRPSNQGRAS